MKNVLIIAFFLQLGFLSFSTEEVFSQEITAEDQEWLSQVGSLRFSEVDWIPLSYTADYPEYRGIIADYLHILSEATGLELEFIQSGTWQEVLDKFGSRDIDLIPALGSEDYVGTEVLLTDSYISFPLVIVTKPDKGFISNTSELEEKLVGVGEGYTSYNFLKNNYPDIELVTTDNVVEGLRLVDKGKIDAFVGHLAVVRYIIENSSLDLRIAGKTEYVFEHRIGLPPEHARTVSIFNKVLARITPEEHNRIYNKWIRIHTDRVDYSLVWKILFAAFVIIAGIFGWNRWIMAEKRRIQGLLNDLETLKHQLVIKNEKLKRLAVTDKLTGLYNRIKLDEVLDSEIVRHVRFDGYFGIILLDIDHFKAVNDSYGHPIGDEVLISISHLLLSHIRKTDILGRWGGEEFLIICPGTDCKGAELLAEKLRYKIESYDFSQVPSCTASFGVSSIRENDDLKQLLSRADEALYAAKKSGRNQVAIR